MGKNIIFYFYFSSYCALLLEEIVFVLVFIFELFLLFIFLCVARVLVFPYLYVFIYSRGACLSPF